MIQPLLILLAFQLFGEAAARGLGLPLPGPLVGMITLVGAIVAAPQLGDWLRSTANGILANLSLLFVPAGVGVATQGDLVAEYGVPLILALGFSTAAAITVGAIVFAAVAHWTDADGAGGYEAETP